MDPAADELPAGCKKLLEKLSQQVRHQNERHTAQAITSNTV
jgi:hypothetical protein